MKTKIFIWNKEAQKHILEKETDNLVQFFSSGRLYISGELVFSDLILDDIANLSFDNILELQFSKKEVSN